MCMVHCTTVTGSPSEYWYCSWILVQPFEFSVRWNHWKTGWTSKWLSSCLSFCCINYGPKLKCDWKCKMTGQNHWLNKNVESDKVNLIVMFAVCCLPFILNIRTVYTKSWAWRDKKNRGVYCEKRWIAAPENEMSIWVRRRLYHDPHEW